MKLTFRAATVRERCAWRTSSRWDLSASEISRFPRGYWIGRTPLPHGRGSEYSPRAEVVEEPNKLLLNAANLLFAYGANPVLRGVDVRLNPGEIVALLGPNGSGKSTLIRVLLGQFHAAGKIDWEQKPLARWHHRELARRVAYLPQQPAWEPGQRVEEALLLGRAPYLQAFGIESARDIEIVRDVSRLLKLDELLPRKMDQLSGGQRQRVFLGRCLAQEPAALLLDEPNTHLDLRYQVELGRILLQLARDRGIGVLMASHEINLAGMFANRLILLSDGKVVGDGSPDEVLRPELLSKVYGLDLVRIERSAGQSPVIVPSS